ncbi:MAG TPA: 23S rRNA (uracil(1939)-C(5))-methyltransferase RlmD [Gammaproteobacteria bacterium]|nr:23S rRNA (uracil(1939)-C(5))-methyltransferase RlmD [Gammaproteobacteria bacterium]
MAVARHARGQRPAPDLLEVEIESLAHDGRGVARVDGKATFVHGALPGERVRVRPVRRRREFDEAEAVAVLRGSPDRVEPGCRYYGACGGCSLQHLAPRRQIEAREQTLLDNLARIAGLRPDRILPPLTGPAWGYRCKARLGVRDVPGKGRVLVGFRERGSSFIADMARCEVLHPAVGDRLEALSGLIGSLDIRRRVPQVEVAVGDDAIALVLRVLAEPGAADRERLGAFAQREGIRIYLQPGGTDSVRPLEGDDAPLRYALDEGNITIGFRPTDFTQVNPGINRVMVDQAMALLRPQGTRVLDLFCGLGNFTLPLARRARQVTGVEGDATLVRRARENAAANRLANVTFHAADLHDPALLRDAPWFAQRFDRVLLDPPRSGAREVLDRIAAAGAERVVYVSCHPASLARDAGILAGDHGYRLEAAGVMDMFPQTSHVEAMACFARVRR